MPTPYGLAWDIQVRCPLPSTHLPPLRPCSTLQCSLGLVYLVLHLAASSDICRMVTCPHSLTVNVGTDKVAAQPKSAGHIQMCTEHMDGNTARQRHSPCRHVCTQSAQAESNGTQAHKMHLESLLDLPCKGTTTSIGSAMQGPCQLSHPKSTPRLWKPIRPCRQGWLLLGRPMSRATALPS